ncbi:twin-arginine translocase TatA/TatE family subunit [Nocardioides pocheonensis]|uniref:Sec-independent protein translocase protein TatA n=2 Tax=Nocardioides pocheonensis TaxID=661485 RepID=A0A3N0GHY7_9ACTN|nr:twin-arginine translocase TatA/TatE family subunit [Nocardioides pocheonensis]
MRNIGPPELMILFCVFVLLFGAKKLPELARGSGRALRIFKAETKGLIDDDDVDADSVLSASDPIVSETPAVSSERRSPIA